MRELLIRAEHEWPGDRHHVTVEFEGLSRFEVKRLTYRTIGPDAPGQQPNGNFAVASALPAAMSLGRPLHLQGEAETDFLANMEEYMAAWCRWLPDFFQPAAISADAECTSGRLQSRPAIMAFSGGLDSVFALHAHKHGLLGRRGLAIEAAVLIHGFDIPLAHTEAFAIARGHVGAILDSYGVRLNTVTTNWQKPFAVKWGMTHVLGIAAVLHLFHRRFGTGLIADDFPYENQVTPWSSNAITNQMLGCAGFAVRTAGAAWSRTEKAAVLAASPAVLEHLRVCYERPELGGNCGSCEKCIRTKLNFYAVGVGRVPALGGPVTLEDVRSAKPFHIEFYTDLLERGTWATRDPIRAEVAGLVRRLSAGPSERNNKLRKRTFLQRISKRAQPLLRATRGAFAGVQH